MSTNAQNLFLLEADLDQFAELMDIAPAVVTRRIVTDLHRRISMRTPVDTGRARASWDVKQGSPSSYVPPVTAGSGAASGGNPKDVAGAIAAISGEAPVFITTALDYVQYLENGSSSQAPAGMVRLSVAEVEIEIESIVGQLTTDSQ